MSNAISVNHKFNITKYIGYIFYVIAFLSGIVSGSLIGMYIASFFIMLGGDVDQYTFTSHFIYSILVISVPIFLISFFIANSLVTSRDATILVHEGEKDDTKSRLTSLEARLDTIEQKL
jgi:hypothetical protein